MPFFFTTPVKKGVQESPQTFLNPEIKNIFPLKMARAQRKPFQIVLCVLLRKALHHLVQLSADGGGGGDLYLAAKAAHPAEKLLADTDGHVKVEVLRVLRAEHRFPAKALPAAHRRVTRYSVPPNILKCLRR